jgi:cytochrome c oxidase accessory protein FixG
MYIHWAVVRKAIPMSKAAPNSPQPSSILGFFAKRRKIYPRRVDGRYRRLKWLAMAVTLAIYYLVPFIRWDRGPNAPDQAVLIDMPHRRAYWFFIEIWPQEVYYLTAILIFAAIALFFVTSLFGRVWCGYFCPQTVWTDLYVWVERIVQGDRAARQRLDNAPLSLQKIWKKGVTHILWLAIAWCTAGSFVLYFNDAPTLVRSFLEFDVSPVVLAFIGGLTFSTYLMAGFAREQVCIYMCPYARFQSAMFDKDTLVIGYDAARGEQRGHNKKGESWDGRGHCVDCTACVQVCPTGIDIRNGLQMDCIACGLCVDACNDIMDKVGLPHGLIRYDTERGLAERHHGNVEKIRLLRPRTVYYTIVLSLIFIVVAYAYAIRKPFELHVLHDRNPFYVRLSDGDIRNGYEVKILNKTHDDAVYSLRTELIDGAELSVRGAGELSIDTLTVAADSIGHYHFFLKAAQQENAKADVRFILENIGTGGRELYDSVFISGDQR